MLYVVPCSHHYRSSRPGSSVPHLFGAVVFSFVTSFVSGRNRNLLFLPFVVVGVHRHPPPLDQLSKLKRAPKPNNTSRNDLDDNNSQCHPVELHRPSCSVETCMIRGRLSYGMLVFVNAFFISPGGDDRTSPRCLLPLNIRLLVLCCCFLAICVSGTITCGSSVAFVCLFFTQLMHRLAIRDMTPPLSVGVRVCVSLFPDFRVRIVRLVFLWPSSISRLR